MSSVNKAQILGRLGADPELRHTASGQAVCELRVAASEKYRDKNEQMQERTEWFTIIVWGKQGENCARFLQKGRQVFVEGRIQTREYDDRDGNKRRKTEIIARDVVFIGGRDSGGGARQSAPTASQTDAPVPFSDDEIPF